MITTVTTTAAAGAPVPLPMLGATDVDTCSGESCATRPHAGTTL